MRPDYSEQIQIKIKSFSPYYVFSAFDFREICDNETANRALSRLKESGEIRRIIQGFYDVPIYSELIKEYSTPSINALAEAIARKYKWTITPCGDTALNILHLSTQVPNVYSFLSDGPNRKFEIGNFQLVFKKCSNREISSQSPMTNLMIQSLKAMGKEKITDEILRQITTVVSDNDIHIAVEESKNSASWIYSNLKKLEGMIC